MIKKQTEAEIETNLLQLNHKTVSPWKIKEGKLSKHFKFANFVEAFAFMTKVAIQAEKSDHHPEWSNVYNQVEVNLTTHEVDGLSERDFALAKLIDTL